MDINDVDEIHVFTDSTTAIRQSLDPSIHSAQECALEILFLITPWVEEGNKRIHFHHVPDSEDYMFFFFFLKSTIYIPGLIRQTGH